MGEDLLDHRRLVDKRHQVAPASARALQGVYFPRYFYRSRPGQAARIPPGLLDSMVGQLRIGQRHLAVMSARLRLVPPPRSLRSSLDHQGA
jgi:hypothetical protein